MKIGFTGTQSVGKSTLVHALKELPEFKDYKFVTERSKYLQDLGIPLNTDSTLLGQSIFLSERASELLHPDIITDRTIVDVMAFTMNSLSIKPSDKDKFYEYARIFVKEYDYIFYISPVGVKIEDNGVRTTDRAYRKVIDTSIKYIIADNLHEMKNFGILSGTTENRISELRSALGI